MNHIENLQDQKRIKSPCFKWLCFALCVTTFLLYVVLLSSLSRISSPKMAARRKPRIMLPPKKFNISLINSTIGLDTLQVNTSICPFNYSYNSSSLSLGLTCLTQLIQKPWQFDFSRAAKFRSMFNAFSKTPDMLVLTKSNCKINEMLQNYIQKSIHTRVSSSVYSKLPSASPYSKKLFNVCSVVGSGGILLNSSCGQAIDQSDYVFRCNVPPIQAFKQHAGSKSNLTTINPISVIAGRYKRLARKTDHARFIKDMAQYRGYIWAPAYSVKAATSLCHKAMFIYNGKKAGSSLVLGHPAHFSRVQDFFKQTYDLTSRISTGFYLTSVALSLCNETRVYGFWPFDRDELGSTLGYHYYDQMRFPYRASPHHFLEEFKIILDLHQKGILKVNIGTCLHQST